MPSVLGTSTLVDHMDVHDLPTEPPRACRAQEGLWRTLHSQWRGFCVWRASRRQHLCAVSHRFETPASCLHGSILRAISRPSRASNGSFCEASATGYPLRWPVAVGTSLSSCQLLGSRLVWQTRLDLFQDPCAAWASISGDSPLSLSRQTSTMSRYGYFYSYLRFSAGR